MTPARSRERALLAATLGASLVVVASHGGVPVSCASQPMRPDVAQTVPAPALRMGQLPELKLSSVTKAPHHATIARGYKVTINQRKGFAPRTYAGVFAGFDPRAYALLFAPEGGHTIALPLERVESISVIGLRPDGSQAGMGALLGGLAGAGVGALAGSVAYSNGSGLCNGWQIPFGIVVGGGLGAGVGAGIGGAVDRPVPSETYRLGKRLWHVDMPDASSAPRQGTAARSEGSSP